MDRSFYYDQSQIRGYDHAWMARDNLLALTQLAQDLHGSTLTKVSGLAATASTPTPNMTVSIAAGSIYSLADVDATAYGPLTSDTNQVLQQGILSTSTSLTFSTSGIPTTGHSQYALVEASFLQTDVIRSDDPNGGLLYFYNSANPSEPFEGPGGDSDTLPTVRLGTITLAIKYGTAATTGSEVPPSADAGAVGLYLVDLAYGQTQITQAEILTAGPLAGTNVPSNYPLAPFIAGLSGRPVVGSYAGNPSGEVAGTVWPNGGTVYAPNFCVNTVNSSVYACTTAGPASSAVWTAIDGQDFLLNGPRVAGQLFNFVPFTYGTRTSMSGSSGNAYTVTVSPTGWTFTKKSSTSAVMALLSAPTFTPSSPGSGCESLVLKIGTVSSPSILAANNVAATSVGQSAVQVEITGLGAGNQAISIIYTRGDSTAWTTILNPSATDETYFPTTTTLLTLWEVGP
jgi:hypothetical protein